MEYFHLELPMEQARGEGSRKGQALSDFVGTRFSLNIITSLDWTEAKGKPTVKPGSRGW